MSFSASSILSASARRASVAPLILAIAIAAAALTGSERAGAGVADTPHNLIGSGRETVAGDDDSNAVCAFCHTPHGDDQSRPLWQSSQVEAGAGFVTFDSFGRSNLKNVEETGSVSLACMSCHDGVQALNVTLKGPVRTVSGSIPTRVSSMIAPTRIGSSSDVSISHPVGMPYGVWRVRTTAVVLEPGTARRGVQAPNADEQRDGGFREPLSAVIDGATVWWLETGAAGRQRGDIHLYTRTVDDDAEAPFVECASCHDPHAERRNFLRRAGQGGLCVSCHAM